MKRYARLDANHIELVKALRAIGASVQSLAAVGAGCPDILCGYRGQNFVFEVKDGKKPPSARKLTPAEQDWIAAWRGEVFVVESVMEALDYINGRKS